MSNGSEHLPEHAAAAAAGGATGRGQNTADGTPRVPPEGGRGGGES